MDELIMKIWSIDIIIFNAAVMINEIKLAATHFHL